MNTQPAAQAATKFLFVMDPAETLNAETETSLLLMSGLLGRGQRVYWAGAADLALAHETPMGRVAAVSSAEPLRRGEPAWVRLDEFDAVLVRLDPPFDTTYLQVTQILDHLDPRVVQFNEVAALRNFNEKLLPLRWPDFTPPTLVSMNAGQIERFARAHRRVVLKPLNDCSGRGIVELDVSRVGNPRGHIEQALSGPDGQSRFVVAQKFLPAVERGDKRVYLLNGRPVGVVNRVPAAGGFLANIHQGAVCEPADLTALEKHIVGTITPFLTGRGIFLAGADFIGGYLTELNITSPSAIRQINQVSGRNVHEEIVDAMLRRVEWHRCCGHWRRMAA